MSDQSQPETAAQQPQRPTALLFVYSWDMLLAILALFGALAPFATAGQSNSLPLPVEIVEAVSSASYAAVLIIVASLLTRRRQWVRRLQMVTLGLAVALVAISVVVDRLIGLQVELAPVLVLLLFALVDVLAIVVMTERRVVSWYVEPGPAPAYVTGTLGFWALSGAALIVVQAVVR